MVLKNALNVVGFTTLVFTLIGGMMVVSHKPKTRLLGTLCYYVTNIAQFLYYILTGAESFLICGLIFSALTTFNMFRISKQIKNGTN
jgi:hypothetical protein